MSQNQLTHWDRDKMDTNSQTTLWSAFSLMKTCEFPIKIALKLVPEGPINNIPELVQIMAWQGPGDKALSEPMIVRLSMHICVTWPQWLNEQYHVNKNYLSSRVEISITLCVHLVFCLFQIYPFNTMTVTAGVTMATIVLREGLVHFTEFLLPTSRMRQSLFTAIVSKCLVSRSR